MAFSRCDGSQKIMMHALFKLATNLTIVPNTMTEKKKPLLDTIPFSVCRNLTSPFDENQAEMLLFRRDEDGTTMMNQSTG